MKTRETYLENRDRNILFHYTPKHCSWLNQIEIWFGILMRKVISQGCFISKKDLKKKVLGFIDYFNETMARPFKRIYRGKPLVSSFLLEFVGAVLVHPAFHFFTIL